jgi:hypothetical protein
MKVIDVGRLSRIDSEKLSFGAMLAAVLVLGGSVVSWAGTCQTPAQSALITAATCSPHGTGCKITSATFTQGGCTSGGSAPCHGVPAPQPIDNYSCNNGISGTCQVVYNPVTGTSTIMCGINFTSGQCVDNPIQLINGVADPNVPPCTPPG